MESIDFARINLYHIDLYAGLRLYFVKYTKTGLNVVGIWLILLAILPLLTLGAYSYMNSLSDDIMPVVMHITFLLALANIVIAGGLFILGDKNIIPAFFLVLLHVGFAVIAVMHNITNPIPAMVTGIDFTIVSIIRLIAYIIPLGYLWAYANNKSLLE